MKSVFSKWTRFWEARLKFKYSSSYADYSFSQLYKKLIVDRLVLAVVIITGVGIVALRTQPDLFESGQMVLIVAGRAILLVLAIDILIFLVSKGFRSQRTK